MAHNTYTVHNNNYADRLATFEGYWTGFEATARQLAAIGHVNDRPPLEALEPGSRCTWCSAFVQRERSIRALQGTVSGTASYEAGFESFDFHHPSCLGLQMRIPLEPQAALSGLHGGTRMNDLKRKFENLASPLRESRAPLHVATGDAAQKQQSSLFALPTELRLQIYSLVLPSLDPTTKIVQLNRDSSRVITTDGYQKTGPRDTTKSNILRTCRAVHAEAMDLLYGTTAFRFAAAKVLYLFLRGIGAAGRALLAAVDVHVGSREDALAFALLATCERLRTLTLRVPRPVLILPHAPVWLFDGACCLLSLRELETVTFASGSSALRWMTDENPDAVAVRAQLVKPRGEPTDMARWDECVKKAAPMEARMPAARGLRSVYNK